MLYNTYEYIVSIQEELMKIDIYFILTVIDLKQVMGSGAVPVCFLHPMLHGHIFPWATHARQ